MNRKLPRNLVYVLALMLVLVLSACGGGGDATTLAPGTVAGLPTVAPPTMIARPPGTPGVSVMPIPSAPGTNIMPNMTAPPIGPRPTALANPNAPTTVLTEAGTTDARTLNPILIGDPVSDSIARLFFSGLITLDPKTGNPLPDLAEAWTISGDGKQYVFTLRKGLQWSDGQSVVPDDVVFTFNLYLNRDANSPRQATISSEVESVSTQGDRAVRFNLRVPAANFLTDIGTYEIVPQHTLVNTTPADLATSDFGTTANVIGTGPFRLTKWLRGERIEAEANPTYHLGKVAVPRYARIVLPTDNAMRDALTKGTADFAIVSPAVRNGLMGVKGVSVRMYATYELTYVGLQLDNTRPDARPATKFLTDPAVRRALMLALDRDAMVRDARSGLATVADGIEPPPSWATAFIDPKYRQNLNEARRLLDVAGWQPGPDGVRTKDRQMLTLTISINNSDPVREAYARLLRDAWKQIGVNATVQSEPFALFRDRITRTHDFDAFVGSYIGSVDPNSLETDLFSIDAAKGGFNVGRYLNMEVDKNLADARVLYKPEQQGQRKDLYIKAQTKVMTDLPILPLDFSQGVVAVSDRVVNFTPSTTDIGLRYRAFAWQWGVNDSAKP